MSVLTLAFKELVPSIHSFIVKLITILQLNVG